jgi:hypothetical protein
LLEPLDLTTVVDHDVLLITSQDRAEELTELRIYRLPAAFAGGSASSEELAELIEMVEPGAFEPFDNPCLDHPTDAKAPCRSAPFLLSLCRRRERHLSPLGDRVAGRHRSLCR